MDIVVGNVLEVELESLLSRKKIFITSLNINYNCSKYINGAHFYLLPPNIEVGTLSHLRYCDST